MTAHNPFLRKEVKEKVYQRHYRFFGEGFGEFLRGQNFALLLIFYSVFLIVVEGFFKLRLGIGFFSIFLLFPFYVFARTGRFTFPMFAPISSGLSVDFENRVPPGAGKIGAEKNFDKPKGLIYFGNEIGTNKEVYFSDSILRAHSLFTGTTGSGKTVGQKTILSGFILAGSGYALQDGKADLKLPVEHFSVLWRCNRIDDGLIINYIRGDSDVWNIKPDSDINTNSFNPYGSAASDTLNEMTKSLLDGDGDIWAKRADAYVSAMIRPNVYLRDKQGIDLNVAVLSDMLILENAGKVLGNDSIPDAAKSELDKFMRTLPGINDKFIADIKAGKSPSGQGASTVLDQFGYISMQIVPVMSMLGSDYGMIFSDPYSERGHVSMADVVMNRRALIILLPALELSMNSLASVGRITLSGQKAMMAKSLGSTLSGKTKRHTDNKPTNSPVPFMSDFEECGYYMVEGFAVTAAQARSIGFALLFAAQDLSAMRKLSDMVSKEVDSIWGNTAVKLFGKNLDPETLKIIIESIGKAKYANLDRLSVDSEGDVVGNLKEDTVSITEEDRVNVRILKNLVEGEVVLNYNDKLVLMQIPMFKTKEISVLALNNYITLENNTSVVTQKENDKQRFLSAVKRILETDETFTITDEFTERFQTYESWMQSPKQGTLLERGASCASAEMYHLQVSVANIMAGNSLDVLSAPQTNNPSINPSTDENRHDDYSDLQSSNNNDQQGYTSPVPNNTESQQAMRQEQQVWTEDEINQNFSYSEEYPTEQSSPEHTSQAPSIDLVSPPEETNTPPPIMDDKAIEADLARETPPDIDDFDDMPSIDDFMTEEDVEKTNETFYRSMAIFDEIFSGKQITAQGIKEQLTQLNDSLSPDMPNGYAQQRADELIVDVATQAQHPSEPTLKPDKQKQVSLLEDFIRRRYHTDAAPEEQ